MQFCILVNIFCNMKPCGSSEVKTLPELIACPSRNDEAIGIIYKRNGLSHLAIVIVFFYVFSNTGICLHHDVIKKMKFWIFFYLFKYRTINWSHHVAKGLFMVESHYSLSLFLSRNDFTTRNEFWHWSRETCSTCLNMFEVLNHMRIITVIILAAFGAQDLDTVRHLRYPRVCIALPSDHGNCNGNRFSINNGFVSDLNLVLILLLTKKNYEFAKTKNFFSLNLFPNQNNKIIPISDLDGKFRNKFGKWEYLICYSFSFQIVLLKTNGLSKICGCKVFLSLQCFCFFFLIFALPKKYIREWNCYDIWIIFHNWFYQFKKKY